MDEVRFDRDLVVALLRDQHPDLADLDLRDVNGGWDNQLWRLGDELAVRYRRYPARSGLAALQNPLRDQPDGDHPEELVAVGTYSAAFGV